MVFSYDWIQSFFRSKLPSPQKMADLFMHHSFEVEGVEKRKEGWILDIDILPNRGPDCFSHYGIAREFAAVSGLKLLKKNSKISEDRKTKASSLVSIRLENGKDCPRYAARVIRGVKVGPSPEWVKQRLEACGLRPINNIVDATNYAMLETGQPLHAFDFDKLEGKGKKEITVRRAKPGEKVLALDDQEYSLDESVLVISGPREILAIAGIKGGKASEIDGSTKDVVLEAANFNPSVINRGSKRINLKTDASIRFEHGLDPNLAEEGINRAAGLILKTAGGKVLSGLAESFPGKVFSKKISLDFSYVEDLLGTEIKSSEAKSILNGLGFKASFSKGTLEVQVPTFRRDVLLPEDVVEEIGRVYGYGKIAPLFPEAALMPPENNEDILWEDACKDALCGLGLSEVYNYSFIPEDDLETFGFKEVLELKNPMSREFRYMRPSLIPHLLDNLRENSKHSEGFDIFELGKTYTKGNPSEKRFLAAALFQKKEKETQFYRAKGIIDILLERMGVKGAWYKECGSLCKTGCFHPRKCAMIMIGREMIGSVGEISSSALDRKGVSGKAVAFEVDFEKLQKLSTKETIYQPVSKYPAAARDMAVLVPVATRVEEVLNRINAAGGDLVREVDLFDIYEGKELPEGKKNLAFHITFQASDKTLSSGEIDGLRDKITKELENDPEWQVRK